MNKKCACVKSYATKPHFEFLILADKLTDKSFNFATHSNQDENEERYEKIGEVITEHVYHLMQEPPYMLTKASLENGSFVFTRFYNQFGFLPIYYYIKKLTL